MACCWRHSAWRPGGDLITAVGDVDARAAEEKVLTRRAAAKVVTGAAGEVVTGAAVQDVGAQPAAECVRQAVTVSSLTPPTFTVAALAAPLSVRAREVLLPP